MFAKVKLRWSSTWTSWRDKDNHLTEFPRVQPHALPSRGLWEQWGQRNSTSFRKTGLDPEEPEKALFISLRLSRPHTAFKGQLESSSESLS